LETALITPPIGVNLYVVQGVRPNGGAVNDVIIGALPFVMAMFFMVAALVAWPSIATWLPQMFYG